MSRNSPLATLKQIAVAAQVSTSTVSRALRDHPLVSKATKERIKEAAQRLDYTPNPYISVLMSHLRRVQPVPYQANITLLDTFENSKKWKTYAVQRAFQEGAEKRGDRLGYRVERYWVGEHRGSGSQKSISNLLQARGIGGVLIPPVGDHSVEAADVPLDLEAFACVTVGWKLQSPGLPFATNDQFASAQLCHDRLFELGYKRVGMVIPQYVEDIVDYRFSAGFRSALERRGKKCLSNAVLRHGEDLPEREVASWVEEFRPDAVCSIFPVVKDWLVAAGRGVPEDVAVALLDVDSSHAGWAGINQNSERVGESAVDLLVHLIQRNERGSPTFFYGVNVEGFWIDGQTAPSRRG